MNHEDQILALLERMDGRLEKLERAQTQFDRNNAVMEKELKDIKSSQNEIKLKQLFEYDKSFSVLERGIADLNDSMETVKADVAKLDKIAPKIDGLYESVVSTGEKFNRLDVVESKAEDHEHRLFALEETLRKAE